ncbi:MarR family transcriptional regulator [Nocardioides sp. TF02-7]|uniref:MarR family winged helix-turn-helix transcriptional regulator n=1 Tax=Nocardioides sp. TF02-7 TaxID=2917724 RepID=UPI001F05FEA7|nr:MarR family transcriptional regulator [Nocardioides sp. TF02-7]UMG91334.1 MarR family transcriptional regulator [Nocardioides sp. TF02-7]
MADDEPNTALLMFVGYRYAEDRIFRSMVEAGFDELTLPQARLFARVQEGGTRLTDLADAAQVTKQTAGYLVEQLERAGYVERVADPADARARLVRASARGEEARAAARVVERQIEDEWTAYLGVRRMRALREALTLLREVTDPFA